MNAFNEYAQEVTKAMHILTSNGFKINHWTQECTGKIDGNWASVTFYPADKPVLLITENDSKYISVAELSALLMNEN